MERRFELRLEELLEDAVLDPRIPEGMLDRLERFVEPFAAGLMSGQQRLHAWEYVAGLFSEVKRKNAESIPKRSSSFCGKRGATERSSMITACPTPRPRHP